MNEEVVGYEAEGENIEVNHLIMELAEKGSVFTGTPSCPGCGPQLGLKLAMQLIDRCVLVTSSGCMSLIMKSVPVPCFHGGLNAIAAAASIAKFCEGNVLCYIGDGALASHMGALHASAERNDNMICICYNNQGFCNMNKPFKNVKEFARVVKAPYVATASVSHIEDFANKIKKASELSGFGFIDLFSPCPVTLGIDSSNTLEAGRLAVETGIWPLYEIDDGELTITERVRKPEPVERYLGLLKTTVSDEERHELQTHVRRKWKTLHKGCV